MGSPSDAFRVSNIFYGSLLFSFFALAAQLQSYPPQYLFPAFAILLVLPYFWRGVIPYDCSAFDASLQWFFRAIELDSDYLLPVLHQFFSWNPFRLTLGRLIAAAACRRLPLVNKAARPPSAAAAH